MAIEEVTEEEVRQRCCGCDALNRIAFNGLTVGVSQGEFVDEHVVPLPPCPTCRSMEFLLRTPDDSKPLSSEGTFGHLHRVLVDHVHAELVRRGQVMAALLDPSGQPRSGLARPPSKDVLGRWFERGLRVERALQRETAGGEGIATEAGGDPSATL